MANALDILTGGDPRKKKRLLELIQRQPPSQQYQQQPHSMAQGGGAVPIGRIPPPGGHPITGPQPRPLMPIAGSGGSSGHPHSGGGSSVSPGISDFPSVGRGGGRATPGGAPTPSIPAAGGAPAAAPAGVPASNAVTGNRTPALVNLANPTPTQAPSLAPLLKLLPPTVTPSILKTIMDAATHNKIQPSLLLGLIQGESNFGQASNTFSGSSMGAQGWTQFMPDTASGQTGYKVPPGGVNVTDTKAGVKSQIYGAAAKLAADGAQKDPVAALNSYNPGAPWYPGYIQDFASRYTIADKLAQAGGGGSYASGQPSGPYTSPFAKSKSFTQSRTDEGVDYTGTGLINAIGKARYLGQGQAWGPEAGGGGTGYGVNYQLLKGPKKGKSVFLYEGIAPAGPQLSPGDVIKKGQPIASFSPGGSIEMGWSDTSGAPIAQPNYSEGDVTGAGRHFQRFLSPLGAASPVGKAGISGTGTGGSPLGMGSSFSSPGAAAFGSGSLPTTAPQAEQAAQQQNAAQPPLISLTPPNAPQTQLFPPALAALFGGQMPQMSGGASLPASGMQNSQLAGLLAMLGAGQNPLQTLSSRNRKRPY